MPNDCFDPSERVDLTLPSVRVVSQLEERRFTLSLLAALSLVILFSQFAAEHHIRLNVHLDLSKVNEFAGFLF